MKCEKCGKEHDGSYGSGRFCSCHCARSFSTQKDNAKETKEALCIKCGKIFNINKRASSKDYICNECRNNLKISLKKPCSICGKLSYKNNKSGFCRESIIKYHLMLDETRNKLSEKAKQTEFWKYKRKRIIEYKGYKFDSSYEIEVAKSLDENNIKWEKPKSFIYHFNNKEHIYTADFYLPDFNIYLDPKNDFLIENINPGTGYKDIDKIKQVELENNIKVFVLDKNNLTWDKIKLIIK